MSDRPRAILRHKGIRPLKRLGQSFLEDHNVIRKIVAAADLTASDVVVEIGAGLGIMTALLVHQAGQVKALEIDPYMVSILRNKFDGLSNIEVIQTDVLKFDFSTARAEDSTKKIKVIGNVPYNISSPILFHVLKYRSFIESMVIMFQKELADRITAGPGNKVYGVPSVMVGMYADASEEMVIPGSCFYPPPRVSSSVLKFIMREKPRYALTDEDAFSRLVKAAFAQRRKTLHNNLRHSSFMDRDEAQVLQLLEKAKIDGRRRAETLSVEEFSRLANAQADQAAPDKGQ
jgi:16S rRNA (adenine1518-N6/adenine1519-N6)-dimethyltransferase